MSELVREQLQGRAVDVARRLLGCVLTSDVGGRRVRIRIVETEAYREDDPASHTYRGPTPRNRIMFGRPGHAYVYFTYGMHHCMNVVCEPDGVGAAVLIRAGEVIEGVDVATERRGDRVRVRDLAAGPARLTQTLGVDKSQDGVDLLAPASVVRLELAAPIPADTIGVGPRVGIRAAADKPWRFWVKDDAAVSRYVRHPKAPPPA